MTTPATDPETDAQKRSSPQKTIAEVDADCNITYSDGASEPCQHRPRYTFSECGPGYGPGRGCAKWDHYHLMGRRRV